MFSGFQAIKPLIPGRPCINTAERSAPRNPIANPIHIVVKINGETVSLPSDNTYQMYTLTADSPERSNVKDNGSLKNNGGEFTIVF